MAFKPVGVDQNGRFPTRVETALRLLFSTRIQRGQAKSAAGVLQWGIPSISFIAVGVATLTPNEVRYVPFEVRSPLTLSGLQIEVTTAPTVAANIAVGIYAANSSHQPVGSALYDSGSIAVASGFTGVKLLTGLTAALTPGLYLMAVNADKAMGLRNFYAPSFTVIPGMGTNALVGRHTAAMPFGAYSSSPLAWTAVNGNSTGYSFDAVLQWAETT